MTRPALLTVALAGALLAGCSEPPEIPGALPELPDGPLEPIPAGEPMNDGAEMEEEDKPEGEEVPEEVPFDPDEDCGGVVQHTVSLRLRSGVEYQGMERDIQRDCRTFTDEQRTCVLAAVSFDALKECWDN